MKIFVPIKHNSQRVPQKNFRIFKGEPLYKYSLLKYKGLEVYVDTDSDEIYESINSDARFSNVSVFMRDEKLVGDSISVCDLILNFIKKYNVTVPIAQVHVTSPF